MLIGVFLLIVIGAAVFLMSFKPDSRLVSQVYAPVSPKKPVYAIVVSGDGLSTPLADTLAKNLAHDGIAAGRVRSLSYFWTSRSPDGMSRDLARSIRNWHKHNPDDRIVLVGYSFGAGTLPFAINRLPHDVYETIGAVILIAPPEHADFEFHFRSWLNKSTGKALETAPEILKLSHTIPVLYLRGEDDYLGPSEQLKTVGSIDYMSLSGGHDFDKRFDDVLQIVGGYIEQSFSVFLEKP
jgi:type IV secretory pathway VirJ component